MLEKFKAYLKGYGNKKEQEYNTVVTGRKAMPLKLATNDATYIACIELISKSMSTIKWALYDMKQTEKDLYMYRKALAVRPNNKQNASTFWKYIERCRLVYGNAYAYIKWNDNGTLGGLIPLEPNEVTIKSNDDSTEFLDTGIVYQYTHKGSTYTFLPEEILHFKANSQDGIKGIPTSEVLNDVLEENMLCTEYLNDLFSNGFDGLMLLSYPSDLNEQRKKTIIKGIKEIVNGKGNKVIATSDEVKVSVVGASSIDSSYMKLRDKGVRQIAGFFGVPLFLLNEADTNGTSAMTSAQASAFYNTVLAPIVNEYANELTAKLLSERQISTGIHFENADINGFSVLSATERVDAFVRLASAGTLTVNEVRRELGINAYTKDDSADLLYRNGAFTSGINGEHDTATENEE